MLPSTVSFSSHTWMFSALNEHKTDTVTIEIFQFGAYLFVTTWFMVITTYHTIHYYNLRDMVDLLADELVSTEIDQGESDSE